MFQSPWGWHHFRNTMQKSLSPVGATSLENWKEYAAPTGLGNDLRIQSTMMPRLRRCGLRRPVAAKAPGYCHNPIAQIFSRFQTLFGNGLGGKIKPPASTRCFIFDSVSPRRGALARTGKNKIRSLGTRQRLYFLLGIFVIAVFYPRFFRLR
jgi:hypothetical protein